MRAHPIYRQWFAVYVLVAYLRGWMSHRASVDRVVATGENVPFRELNPGHFGNSTFFIPVVVLRCPHLVIKYYKGSSWLHWLFPHVGTTLCDIISRNVRTTTVCISVFSFTTDNENQFIIPVITHMCISSWMYAGNKHNIAVTKFTLFWLVL